MVKPALSPTGIRYGFEGDRLMEFVKERLRQCEEREERRARRQEGALRTESSEKLKKMNERIARVYEGDGDAARVRSMGGTAETPCHSGGCRPLMKVPTYDGRQPLECYLDLFEDICVTNKFDENEWLLRLRITLSGSTVNRNCVGCSSYEEAKRDLLASLGRTQDVEAHDVEAHDVEAHDVEAQEVEAQEVEAQDVEAQEREGREAKYVVCVCCSHIHIRCLFHAISTWWF